MRFFTMPGRFSPRWLLRFPPGIIVLFFGLAKGETAPDTAAFDTNRVMSVELQIAPEDWKALRYQHREAEFFPEENVSPLTNAYSWFSAEARVNGVNVGRVEVRKKGYIGSNDTKRPALKLRLPANQKSKINLPWSELTLN